MNIIYDNMDSVLDKLSTQEEYKKLSLLYQSKYEYAKEELLIKKALEQYPDWIYMREREEWHRRPLFHVDPQQSKVIPRKPIRFERAAAPPAQEVLEQLCFVIAADEGFFSFIIEAIESIRATVLYKEVAICILDCGLTDEQRHYISQRVEKLVIPEWDVRFEHQEYYSIFLKAMVSRIFLNKYFPEYRYYFYIDADVWIYNETAVDQYVFNAQKYGLGIARDVMEYFHQYVGHCDKNYMADKYWDEDLFGKSRQVNAGIFCIDKESPLLKKWQEIFIAGVDSKPYSTLMDQVSLNVLIAHKNFSHVLDEEFNYNISGYGAPMIKRGVLYMLNEHRAIGLVHFTTYAKVSPIAYRFPVLFGDKTLTNEELHEHKRYFWEIHDAAVKEGKDDVECREGYLKASLRYREFPQVEGS